MANTVVAFLRAVKFFRHQACTLAMLGSVLACTNVSADTVLRIGGTGSAMASAVAMAQAYASISNHARPRVLSMGSAGG